MKPVLQIAGNFAVAAALIARLQHGTPSPGPSVLPRCITMDVFLCPYGYLVTRESTVWATVTFSCGRPEYSGGTAKGKPFTIASSTLLTYWRQFCWFSGTACRSVALSACSLPRYIISWSGC